MDLKHLVWMDWINSTRTLIWLRFSLLCVINHISLHKTWLSRLVILSCCTQSLLARLRFPKYQVSWLIKKICRNKLQTRFRNSSSCVNNPQCFVLTFINENPLYLVRSFLRDLFYYFSILTRCWSRQGLLGMRIRGKLQVYYILLRVALYFKALYYRRFGA